MTKTLEAILESLEPRDLDGLVEPVVSVDEFVPKMDPDAVVVSFLCASPEAAADLLSFVWYGAWPEMLDVDMDDIPDSKGRWRVYVEFRRGPQTARIVDGLLADVSRVTGVDSWVLNFPEREPVRWRRGVIGKHLRTEATGDRDLREERRRELTDFLGGRCVDEGLRVAGRMLPVLCFGDRETILSLPCFRDRGPVFEDHTVAEAMRIVSVLGPEYDVDGYGDVYLVTRHDSDRVLVVGS